jgi:hypothetical protein
MVGVGRFYFVARGGSVSGRWPAGRRRVTAPLPFPSLFSSLLCSSLLSLFVFFVLSAVAVSVSPRSPCAERSGPDRRTADWTGLDWAEAAEAARARALLRTRTTNGQQETKRTHSSRSSDQRERKGHENNQIYKQSVTIQQPPPLRRRVCVRARGRNESSRKFEVFFSCGHCVISLCA